MQYIREWKCSKERGIKGDSDIELHIGSEREFMEGRYIVDRDMVRYGEKDWEKEMGDKERFQVWKKWKSKYWEFWLTDESMFRDFLILGLGSKKNQKLTGKLNLQMDTKLPWIKSGKPKSIKNSKMLK